MPQKIQVQLKDIVPNTKIHRMAMLTSFQIRVLRATCQIPKGKVTSYRLLAKAVNCGSAQAIGQALKNNPFAPAVPCHRVISQTGRLHGFQGSQSDALLSKKARLLRAEGVRFSRHFEVAADQIVAL